MERRKRTDPGYTASRYRSHGLNPDYLPILSLYTIVPQCTLRMSLFDPLPQRKSSTDAD